jgi:DNA-binding response OmpR family regulator
MRILYLEDNPNDATLMARYIKTTPHELVVVATLDEAYAAVDQSFDLILVDVMLGDERQGYTFAQRLRQRLYQQPMIAVTALGSAEDEALCAQLGFDYVLPKPFTIMTLASLINAYAS